MLLELIFYCMYMYFIDIDFFKDNVNKRMKVGVCVEYKLIIEYLF